MPSQAGATSSGQPGNNIGIIQNFNSYHIELKNMNASSNGGSPQNQGATGANNNIQKMYNTAQLSPDEMRNLDRLVKQQANLPNGQAMSISKKGNVISPRTGQYNGN
mmetsp:Transcript_18453/g.28308  ORF Transcript_18453/g.28308 Transcript_18453/m.28308 type:complete len:107 (-) Transcript_18453:1868-2188(-)